MKPFSSFIAGAHDLKSFAPIFVSNKVIDIQQLVPEFFLFGVPKIESLIWPNFFNIHTYVCCILTVVESSSEILILITLSVFMLTLIFIFVTNLIERCGYMKFLFVSFWSGGVFGCGSRVPMSCPT